jgi:MIP family channel proteins
MYSKLSTSLVAELIGTFALIFIGAGAVAANMHPVGVALAFGFVVVSFAYSFGHISGAHLNPAVTLGVWVAGKIETTRAVAYMAVQVIGGALAAFTLRTVLGGPVNNLGMTKLAQAVDLHGTAVTITPAMGLIIEAILTFVLVNTVMNAGLSAKATIQGGLAIGLALAFGNLMAIPLTGAGMNPARSIGPALVVGNFDDLWVYIVGPAIGGLVAGLLYKGFFEERA